MRYHVEMARGGKRLSVLRDLVFHYMPNAVKAVLRRRQRARRNASKHNVVQVRKGGGGGASRGPSEDRQRVVRGRQRAVRGS
jgi:hypothetical protein